MVRTKSSRAAIVSGSLMAAMAALAAMAPQATEPAPAPAPARAPGSGEPQPPLHWPQFRGPRGSGVADGTNPPLRWDGATSRNILWKTAIPGLGHASPVVWGERVFVVSAVGGDAGASVRVGLYGDIAPADDSTRHAWRIACLHRDTGKVLWERTAHEGAPRVKRHPKATHANSTPATDGARLAALLGSEGLCCLDLDGSLLWKVDLGPLDAGFYRVPDAQWGFGSSPVIHEGRAIVQCDVQKGSFLAAFDLADGKEVWRVARDDVPTWSTPLVIDRGGGAEVIVNGFRHAGGYDAASGKELWRLSGGGDIPVPTPVAGDGLVFLTSAHGDRSPIVAVRLGAEGDCSLRGEETSSRDVAWSIPRGGNYMQTPLLYGGNLYACRDNGVLGCFEAATGKRFYTERLGDGAGGFTASPVAADGRIYFTGERGDVHVVAAGPEFRVLATNSLGEDALATPALAPRMVIVRTVRHVWGIAEE